ncbi:MAG: 4Fe-4S binding protein, partial [Prevotellaceae bacterium]|nr:4Fe-4S binding protein [Prevotellaceae bacterium]
MLRKIRLVLAVLFTALITLLFLDLTGTLHSYLGWMAKIQFLPAILALNVTVIVALVLLTLLLGRVYCSVICPLGVMQDFIAWLSKRGKKRRRYKYGYRREWRLVRIFFLVLMLVAIFAGIGSLMSLLAPYSNYGRIVGNLLAPLYGWGNNLLATIAEHFNSYTFYSVAVWMPSLATFLIALFMLLLVAYMSWTNGRLYCNSICPVGTVLGYLSKFSLMRITIDTDRCTGCKLCSRACKSLCIDSENHRVDYSRCVACFDCLGECREGALHYRSVLRKKKNTSDATSAESSPEGDDPVGRRAFLLAGAMMAGSAVLHAQEKRRDGGFAVIEDKVPPARATHLEPPGAQGIRHFAKHCTSCQLCVSACPSRVLEPSRDLMNLMQPFMTYERGYCRPECTACSEVCPSGAITRITKEEKSS